MRSLIIAVLIGMLLAVGTLPVAASYNAVPLPKALKEHDVVLVAKVTRRADGNVTLVPEQLIKGDVREKTFQLPDTWPAAESKFWTPSALLERKRYLLMLHRNDAGKLVYSKDPIAESVREVSYVDDTDVRIAAVVMRLIEARDAKAREHVLDQAWIDESDQVKERLLHELLSLGPDEATVPYLIRCINAGATRSGLMEVAAAIIAKHQYRQTVPALLKGLEKDDWACIYPARALGALKAREAYEPLMALIKSPIAQNRVYFVEALCMLDDERAIPFLIESAQYNLPGIDPAYNTRRPFDVRENEFAVACLGRLRAKQATEVLEQIAAKTTYQELRKLAIEALEGIRSAD